MRFLVLVACTGMIAVGAIAVGRSEPGVRSQPESPAGSPVASCASASCHGGGAVGQRGSEQSTWAAADPHAKAYRVLFNDRSAQMMKNLGRSQPAYRETACLACHATHEQAWADGNVVESAADGVGCDSCHGSSRYWLAKHYEPGWRSLAPEQKHAFGFISTKDLVTRITACAACHVGDASRIVDHDLIAAGHPRLAFEYTRFHFQPDWKHHWVEPLPRRDFEVRSWLIGQLVSLRACIHKLDGYPTDRLRDLGDQSCFACHQQLKGNTRPRNRLTPSWQPWYMALIEVLAAATPAVFPGAAVPPLEQFQKLEAVWKTDAPPAEITRLTAEAEETLTVWLQAIQRVERSNPDRRLSPADLRSMARIVADSAAGTQDWDLLASHFLALAAFHHADPLALADCTQDIQQLQQNLGFPQGYNSPAVFDPATCTRVFQTIHAKLERQDQP